MNADLILSRLEAATRGSRELDEAIATLLWGEPRPSGNPGEQRVLRWWSGGVGRTVAPEFTTSIDAAMMMLPDGWRLNSLGDHGETWDVELAARHGREWRYGYAKTAAHALCIACLRARADTDG